MEIKQLFQKATRLSELAPENLGMKKTKMIPSCRRDKEDNPPIGAQHDK